MFGKKKAIKPTIQYNAETMQPVLKCSICTGEQVAGFKDKTTGKFIGVTLVKSEKDLDVFLKTYNLTEISKEY